MTNTVDIRQHGGKRQGAGRKKGSGAFREATKVMRIPESQVSTIESYLQQLKSQLQTIDPAESALQLLSEQHIPETSPAGYQLPLYSHKVVAGFPSPADDYIEEYLDLNEKLVINQDSTFLLKVQGDSMQDIGIYEDDILVVDRKLPAKHGKIVIAALDGELTVKRLQITKEGTFLAPENPNYPLIKVSEESEMVIWGVVTSCIHSF